MDDLPDLAVEWDASFPWSALHSPRLGTLEIRPQDARSGSHTTHGFLLAAGPGVPAGAELRGHSTLDIAPTVLAGAGVPLPSHLDGRPILPASAR